jgi:hypothetical protein
MLWFNHPRPVGRGRAVATLIQRHTHKRASLTIATPKVDLPTLCEAKAAPPSLEFSVRYALAEYVSFMWQHAGWLIRRRRIGRLRTWTMRIKSTGAAAFHFIAMRRSRWTYQFTIDAHGIVRVGPGGVTLIDWADVSAIRTYARGFLMILKRGTLPIPFRCLTSEQSSAMIGFGAALRAVASR